MSSGPWQDSHCWRKKDWFLHSLENILSFCAKRHLRRSWETPLTVTKAVLSVDSEEWRHCYIYWGIISHQGGWVNCDYTLNKRKPTEDGETNRKRDLGWDPIYTSSKQGACDCTEGTCGAGGERGGGKETDFQDWLGHRQSVLKQLRWAGRSRYIGWRSRVMFWFLTIGMWGRGFRGLFWFGFLVWFGLALCLCWPTCMSVHHMCVWCLQRS